MARLIKEPALYKKPWYNTYRSMLDRCYRRNAKNYPQYGGRGIEVCESWHDPEKFAEWVESSGYMPGMTIDRINVNLGYCPSNCRWATWSEQANNRRSNVRIDYQGETHTLAEWSVILGINKSTMKNRYHRGDRGEKLMRKVETNAVN